MSIMNVEVVDAISIDPKGSVVLTVSDELEWDYKNEHLFALQNKINAYLGFIESGNIYQEYPDAKDRYIVISVVAKYEPNDNGKLFLDATEKLLQSSGYKFKFSVFGAE